MLDLIICEFAKTKRTKLLLILITLSCLFPFIVVFATKQGMTGDMNEHYLKMRFDLSYTMTQGYGLVFLAPCLIGMLSAVLFFMERDNDTFKNLRVIPISVQKLVGAKVCVIFIYSILFSLSSVTFIIVFSEILGVGIVYDVSYKLAFSILFGIAIAVASMPIIALIVYFNKSYLVSVLFAFFYSILNWGIIGLFESIVNEKTSRILNLFPVICAMNWTSGNLVTHVIKDNLSQEAYIMFPSNAYAVIVLTLTFVISLLFMFRFYKKWTR